LVAAFPHFEAWFPILENGQYLGNVPDRDLLWYEISYPNLLAALDGNMTHEEALAAMEREANETLG
jgi:hypothetical protein